jgi:hypothetical protein
LATGCTTEQCFWPVVFARPGAVWGPDDIVGGFGKEVAERAVGASRGCNGWVVGGLRAGLARCASAGGECAWGASNACVDESRSLGLVSGCAEAYGGGGGGGGGRAHAWWTGLAVSGEGRRRNVAGDAFGVWVTALDGVFSWALFVWARGTNSRAVVAAADEVCLRGAVLGGAARGAESGGEVSACSKPVGGWTARGLCVAGLALGAVCVVAVVFEVVYRAVLRGAADGLRASKGGPRGEKLKKEEEESGRHAFFGVCFLCMCVCVPFWRSRTLYK